MAIKINVASENPVKIAAVQEAIKDYTFLSGAEVVGMAVGSDVSKQPKTLEETIQGAVNRAKKAFINCSYSFGIESGLMHVPQTKTGSMDVCVCVVYDGKTCHIGLSSAFEFPPVVTKMIHELGVDANDAFHKCGLTENPKIGQSEGAIGLLTKGRITRKEYTKQAIRTALIHLENPNLY